MVAAANIAVGLNIGTLNFCEISVVSMHSGISVQPKIIASAPLLQSCSMQSVNISWADFVKSKLFVVVLITLLKYCINFAVVALSLTLLCVYPAFAANIACIMRACHSWSG